MNLAKTLTNGAVPMGAVLVKGEIYQAFVDEEAADHLIGLPHGYTYTGRPVACAAALTAMDIFEQEDMPARVRALAPTFENTLHALKGERNVSDIRNFGLAGAVQIEARDQDPMVRPYEIGLACWKEGLYVRWGGDTLQFAPPFVASEDDIEQMGDILRQVIKNVA